MGQLLAASLSRIFPARFTLYGIRNWLMRSNSINILMVTLNVSSSFISASINLKLKKLTKLKCGVDVKMNSFEESMQGQWLWLSWQNGCFWYQRSAVQIETPANFYSAVSRLAASNSSSPQLESSHQQIWRK